MKTISVKQAATALGLSPRAIQYKLQNGDLKGTRSKNQFGKSEWRIWPTKDIAEALKKIEGVPDSAGSADELNFEAVDSETIDAEEVNFNDDEEFSTEPINWRQVEMERLELMAEKLVKPLADRIEAQAMALREQESVIEDQKRQLRLLPDFQKQAEDERKAAEIRAMEVVALSKQLEAIEEEKKLLAIKANEATVLSQDLQELKSQVEQLRKPFWKKWFSAN